MRSWTVFFVEMRNGHISRLASLPTEAETSTSACSKAKEFMLRLEPGMTCYAVSSGKKRLGADQV